MLAALRVLVSAVILALLLGISARPAGAEEGKLDTFEQDANTPPNTTDTHHHHHGHHHDDEDNNPFTELMEEIFQEIFIATGQRSWDRVARPDHCAATGMPMRRHGDPTIPLLRLDAALRNVEPTIHALDVRAEAGFGPMAAQYNYLEFTEDNPADTMIIREYFALYRMSFGTDIEIDFGAGQLRLDGNTHTTRGAVILPVLLHPARTHWGLEYRPVWADGINDYDIALLYTRRALSFKGGYRWVIGPNHALNGPYLGMAWRL